MWRSIILLTDSVGILHVKITIASVGVPVVGQDKYIHVRSKAAYMKNKQLPPIVIPQQYTPGLPCEAKRKYVLTLQESRYCLLPLQNSGNDPYTSANWPDLPVDIYRIWHRSTHPPHSPDSFCSLVATRLRDLANVLSASALQRGINCCRYIFIIKRRINNNKAIIHSNECDAAASLSPYIAGIDFRRQSLTSVDVRFWRLKPIP